MTDIITGLVIGSVATFAPLFTGLFAPVAFSKIISRDTSVWLIAMSAGTMFWFFLDVMGDAALLDVNLGFGHGLGNYTHLVLALMFALGIGALLIVEGRFSVSSPAGRVSPKSWTSVARIGTSVTFAVAALAAAGIGFHALGEGVDIGSTLPSSSDILQAIGGILPGVAYVLHKLLEGFVIGVFAVISANISARKIGILGMIAGFPTLIGFFIGIPGVVDSSYFFALGGAGAVYVELKLIPLLGQAGRPYASVVPFLLGFYAMYVAGLFHS